MMPKRVHPRARRVPISRCRLATAACMVIIPPKDGYGVDGVPPTIPGNASITRLSAITSVLFPPPEVYSAGRPVLNLSFALNHAIGGTAAGAGNVIAANGFVGRGPSGTGTATISGASTRDSSRDMGGL